MYDSEGYEHYMRQRISLEQTLEGMGDLHGSKEIETQMQFVGERLLAKIKQTHLHAAQEMSALRMVFVESCKDA